MATKAELEKKLADLEKENKKLRAQPAPAPAVVAHIAAAAAVPEHKRPTSPATNCDLCGDAFDAPNKAAVQVKKDCQDGEVVGEEIPKQLKKGDVVCSTHWLVFKNAAGRHIRTQAAGGAI